jgi:hypothetical protein
MKEEFRVPVKLFELGQVVATLGVMGVATRYYQMECLARHVRGDWGCCCDEDKATNDDAIKYGNRVLSSYPLDPAKPCKGYGSNTLWIITEADRSVTTFLLPDEY